MNQLTKKSIGCPYCGEIIKVLIDSTDIDQQYIEELVNVYSEDEAF